MGSGSKRRQLKSSAAVNLHRKETFKYVLVIEGAVIGLIVGVVIAAFRVMLKSADALRATLILYAKSGPEHAALVFALLAGAAALIIALIKFEPETAGSGIPQVEGELKGMVEQNWVKVMLAKLAGCALSIGAGLALGREGPSIQIGAMIGKGFARKSNRLLTEERMLITAGAGAGLSAAFGAPLAGAVFSLEELHKNFSAEILIMVMTAAAFADFIAANIVGLQPVFNFDVTHRLPLKYYWLVAALGAILGLIGAFYNRTIAFMQDFFGRFSKHNGNIALIMLCVFILMFVYPEALGSGNAIPAEIVAGKFALRALAVLLVVKFVFSTASYGSGVPGGIFLPMLALGAMAGGVYSELLGAGAGLDQRYITSFVIVAMAGLFAAIVKAPVTGIILITEMTGDFSSLLALTVCTVVAYIVSDLCGGRPIYEELLERRLDRDGENRHRLHSGGAVEGRSGSDGRDGSSDDDILHDVTIDTPRFGRIAISDRKIIITAEVYMGSYMDGRLVSDLHLPHGSLIVAIVRGNTEIIPSGDTKLLGGDIFHVLCSNGDIIDAEEVLDEKCRKVLPMDL